MRVITNQSGSRTAYTIIELLTVMTIIIILIGLLVPALNMVRRRAKEVKQQAQFHAINVAMELFNTEFEGYPDSGELGSDDQPYCGAMKLCEAMMGQDLLGFHPDSRFRGDLTDGGTPSSIDLYPDPSVPENLRNRKKPYLQLENANGRKLKDLYGTRNTTFEEELFVLCDVFTRLNQETGEKTGMPVLYYRARLTGTKHPVEIPEAGIVSSISVDDPDNIYDYRDNDELVLLGLPWHTSTEVEHPMASEGAGSTGAGDPTDPYRFYRWIWNDKIDVTDRPYRSDSYILLSAGFDGEYGTRDDIHNFAK